jgi:hypothetical protein
MNNSDSYMAKVENVLSEWEAHGIDAAQARKRFREVVQEWLASPYGPVSESPDEWYARERAAFISWWESEGQAKFSETPTIAAGAGWFARAEKESK